MKIAFMVQAHTDPSQVARLVERLHPHDVYIHVDAKTSRDANWQSIDATFVEPRAAVYWGGFSQISATLNSMRTVLASKKQYSKLVLLSGACYPIKPIAELERKFDEDSGFNYIKYVDMRDSEHLMTLVNRAHLRDAPFPAILRLPKGVILNKVISRSMEKVMPRPKWRLPFIPYHGSQWWALSPEAAAYCVDQMDSNPLIEATYRRVFAPDEQVFHTLIGNSPFRDRATGEFPFVSRGTYKAANLHVIHASLAKFYDISDMPDLAKSDRFFVRKVSSKRSGALLDAIDKELLS